MNNKKYLEDNKEFACEIISTSFTIDEAAKRLNVRRSTLVRFAIDHDTKLDSSRTRRLNYSENYFYIKRALINKNWREGLLDG